MEKYIYDKRNGLWYELHGDYYLPCLEAPEEPSIGIWGKRRASYLREHRKPIYLAMMIQGTLNAHLEEVDRSANEMLERLISQMAEAEGITEELKARDQLAWVRAMNNIRQRAEEIVYQELIHPEEVTSC